MIYLDGEASLAPFSLGWWRNVTRVFDISQGTVHAHFRCVFGKPFFERVILQDEFEMILKCFGVIVCGIFPVETMNVKNGVLKLYIICRRSLENKCKII